MDDPMATATAIETHVAALSGFSVELMVEDLQTCIKAYKDDKSHVAAYTKLRQGQKYQDVYLTPSGLYPSQDLLVHEVDKWLMIGHHCDTSRTSLQVVPPTL